MCISCMDLLQLLPHQFILKLMLHKCINFISNEVNKMRTTITLPDELVKDLMHHTHTKKTTEAVVIAVQEWIRMKKINEIKKLRGKLDIDPTLKELRQKEIKKLDDLNG